MATVILSGATDALGHRVHDRLLSVGDTVVTVADGDLASDVKAKGDGASRLIHLAGGLDDTREVLDVASGVGVEHVVLLSSATVYGAWPSNPVPLTEDATIRPNPELEFAVRAAERERLAGEWKLDHPHTTLTILRPAIPVAEGASGWLAEGVLAASTIKASDVDDPPAQYVHLDDLADAVVLGAARRIDGVRNVAPEGWITGEELRALAGGPRLRVPPPLARGLSPVRARFGRRAAHPGLTAYTSYPWVVASDRLRAEGWSPAFSNEEAFVAGHAPAPWSTISPQRRQELALGAMVAGIAGVVVGAVVVTRRTLRRRAR